MGYRRAVLRGPPLTEALLQSAVIEHLRAYGNPEWLWWHTPNAGKRHPITGSQLKRQGMVAGVGDLSLVDPTGRYHELELKTADGRLSPAQRERLDALKAHGVPAGVAYGLDAALGLLRAWGALR
jgi:VRR-NUC domain